MAQLLVRNLDDEVVQALKLRAVRNGRSAEAEHREILKKALIRKKPRLDFKALLLSMPDFEDEGEFDRVQDLGRAVEL